MKGWRRRTVLFLAVLGLTGVLGGVYSVPEGRQVVLTRFGRPRLEPVTQPGWHFRIPFVDRVHELPLEPSFENSLVLAPLYPRYVQDSDEKFRLEAEALRAGVGGGRHVLLGFAAFVSIQFPAEQMAPTLNEVDVIVQRARESGLIAHISLLSGFFHGWNALRESAVREDVRNAQWFADGWIAPETDLQDAGMVPRSVWVTPSRYALPLRTRIEEGVRTLGAHLARRMSEHPGTLVTLSGDGEAEYTYERNFLGAAERLADNAEIIYADYSPFMVAEFRDETRERYAGDASPGDDTNGDGRSFNKDFGRDFTTWKLRYYDESGPIPFAEYQGFAEKLPSSGRFFTEGGFDPPRKPLPEDPLWKAWMEFRKGVLARWVSDFAGWITTSKDPVSGFTIPPSRFYTHQIPADFLFGNKEGVRLETSASFLETAFAGPVASAGVTAFNVYTGERHAKTAAPPLFAALTGGADHWGILEYNPSVPANESIAPSPDEDYYVQELEELYRFRPHVLVPFAWSDVPEHRRYRIQGSAFERGLRRFVERYGNSPWFSLRGR